MRKSRAKEVSMEITVGFFMFMVLLALAVFTIVLSTENIFRESYRMTVAFEDVLGLRAGDNVHVRGLKVGKVKDLRLEPEGVYVDLSLDSDVKLRRDYRIEITASSALGGRHIQIYEGSLDAEFLPEGSIVRGLPPVDLMAEAGKAVESVRDALEEGGILANLKSSMAHFEEITAKINQGQGTLGKLVNDDGLYQEIQEVAADLKKVSAQLASGEGTIGKLLMDDTMYNDFAAVGASLRDISDRLARGEGTLGKLLSEDDELYRNLSDAAASISDITGTISRGEGTLGKLAKDDELYLQVQLLVHELRATVDDFRETAPITTFTSIFFGAF